MPTYDYECGDCRHKFEVFQNMMEKPLTDCPKCKGKIERLIGSGCGLIFKGSGFFVTDYKKSASSGKPAPEKKDNPSCQSCPANSQCEK